MLPIDVDVLRSEYGDRTPTNCLIPGEPGEHSCIVLYRHIRQGINLKDVWGMLSVYDASFRKQVMNCILGVPIPINQMRPSSKSSMRLSSQQSAAAYLYAEVFEQAIAVFGTRELAVKWLNRPCPYLEGYVPLEMVGNVLGYQAVQHYLAGIRYGVYQ
ncbi:antitoxin Xre/MbcA/ParS toxin-binding domain-containing protein [Pseudomonas monsensis]